MVTTKVILFVSFGVTYLLSVIVLSNCGNVPEIKIRREIGQEIEEHKSIKNNIKDELLLQRNKRKSGNKNRRKIKNRLRRKRPSFAKKQKHRSSLVIPHDSVEEEEFTQIENRRIHKIVSDVDLSTGVISFDMSSVPNNTRLSMVRRMEIYLTLREQTSDGHQAVKSRNIGTFLLENNIVPTILKRGKYIQDGTILQNKRNPDDPDKKMFHNFVFEITSLLSYLRSSEHNILHNFTEQNSPNVLMRDLYLPSFGIAINCRKNGEIRPCQYFDVFVYENPYLVVQYATDEG